MLGSCSALVLMAPLLGYELDLVAGADVATLGAAEVIIEAPLPLTTKIPIALDMRDEFEQTPEGEIPDLVAPFEENGAADDPRWQPSRTTSLEAIACPHPELPDVVLPLRALAALALVPILGSGGGGWREAPDRAFGVLGALFAAAAALITLEFVARRRRRTGRSSMTTRAPRSRVPRRGHRRVAAAHRVRRARRRRLRARHDPRGARALPRAVGSGAEPIPWDDETIERAVRAGLLESIDDAEQRGSLNGLLAVALRQVVEHAPVSG